MNLSVALLAGCSPIVAQKGPAPTEPATDVKIVHFYPGGNAGLYRRGEAPEFRLDLRCDEPDSTTLRLAIDVRDFYNTPVHEQEQTVTLSRGVNVTRHVKIPNQSRLGFFAVQVRLFRPGQAPTPIAEGVSSFCVVDPPTGPNDPFFGVNKFRSKSWMHPALSWIGVGTMPVGAYRHSIEANPGQYDWTRMDRSVCLYEKAGFQLLGFHTAYDPLGGGNLVPQWEYERIKRRHDAGLPPHDDEHFQTYARFVEKMVTRYRGRIKTWYLTDEIDKPMRTNWDAPMRYYVRRIRTFSRAARKADPNCHIVAIGVAGSDARKNPPYPAARAIWEQVHDSLDGFWPHPYASPRYIRPNRRVRIPEAFLRRNLLDALAMIEPTGKSNLGISENGYAIRPDLATWSPQARTMANLAARTLILARSVPQLQCICYFTVFKFEEGGHTYGLWEIEGSGRYPAHRALQPESPKWPRPVVAAFATVTQFIGHSIDPRLLKIHRDIHACAFRKPKGWVIAAWTTLTTPVKLTVDAPLPVDVHNLMGNRIKRSGPDGLQIDLTDGPLFLVGADGDYEAAIQRFESARSSLPRLALHPRLAGPDHVAVVVGNQTNRQLEVTVALDPIESVHVREREQRIKLPALGKRTVSFKLDSANIDAMLDKTLTARAEMLSLVTLLLCNHRR